MELYQEYARCHCAVKLHHSTISSSHSQSTISSVEQHRSDESIASGRGRLDLKRSLHRRAKGTGSTLYVVWSLPVATLSTASDWYCYCSRHYHLPLLLRAFTSSSLALPLPLNLGDVAAGCIPSSCCASACCSGVAIEADGAVLVLAASSFTPNELRLACQDLAQSGTGTACREESLGICKGGRCRGRHCEGGCIRQLGGCASLTSRGELR